MVDSPNDALQTSKVSGLTKGQGRWAKKSENPKNSEKLSPGGGGRGYWGGRPLGDKSAVLSQHKRDMTHTFMVESPSDKPTKFQVQTHQGAGLVSKRNQKIKKSRIGILTPAGAAGATFAISHTSPGSCIRDFRTLRMRLLQEIAIAAAAGSCELGSGGKSCIQFLQEIANAVPVGNRACGFYSKLRIANPEAKNQKNPQIACPSNASERGPGTSASEDQGRAR